MNRTIKYKVWDTRLKKMYQWEEVKNWNFYWVDAEYFVFLEFTGLMDKNKVEIYNSDILAVWSGGNLGTPDIKTDIIRIVSFNEYALGYLIKTPKDDYCTLTKSNVYQLEVLGNIFQTPSLINQPTLK